MRLRQPFITYKHQCMGTIKSRLYWLLCSTIQILYSEIYMTDKGFVRKKTETGSYLTSFTFLKADRMIEWAPQLLLNYLRLFFKPTE